MNMCEVCGKPIPRTTRMCEDCKEGLTIPANADEFLAEEEEELD